MPERLETTRVDLQDGRTVHVLEYDDGSVRFRLSGAPYSITEAFLPGTSKDHAIIKLEPKITVGR